MELLVVIAIIGTLVALLLPAVQAAREAARRTTCENHLRQIGLALVAYHDVKEKLPLGGRFAWKPGRSWTAELLPWLEESPLFDTIDVTARYTDPTNLVAGQTVLPGLLCPSVPDAATHRKSADLPFSSTIEYARTSYGAVQGERGLRSPTATNNPERGAMIYERSIAFSQITDGTSKTLLVGEAPTGIHSIWIGTRNLFDQSAPIKTRSQSGFTDFGQELSGYHPTGVAVVMADSSVRFLAESIDDISLAALCSRDAGDGVAGTQP